MEVENGVILVGDCLKLLQKMEPGSIRCCVTSPPYWGLRKYMGQEGIGNEPTIHGYVENMVSVCREIGRVLTKDGTLWLNIGDTFAASGSKDPKAKNLIGSPWRVALALQDDGWWLRGEIIWHKKGGKPESAGTHGHSGRPTRAHEHVFLLTRSPRYYYDLDASMEPSADGTGKNRRSVWTIQQGNPYKSRSTGKKSHTAVFPPDLVEPCIRMGSSEKGRCPVPGCGKPWVRVIKRGKSTYARMREEQGIGWQEMQDESERRGTAMKGGVTATGGTRTASGAAAHLKRASRETLRWEPSCECGKNPVPEVVLDPFFGSGTVGSVCERFNRRWCGIELSRDYAELARERILYDIQVRKEETVKAVKKKAVKKKAKEHA